MANKSLQHRALRALDVIQEGNTMSTNYQIFGWVYIVYSLFAILTTFVPFLMFNSMFSSDDSAFFSTFINVGIFIVAIISAIHTFTLACGIGLVRKSDKAKIYAIPASILLLLMFPIGTVVGAAYLAYYMTQRNE